MAIDDKIKCIYLLDELLEINDFGLYSVGIVEMVTREITKKSYRETAKTISENTDSTISYTAVRNIVLKLGEKIKKLEEEKIELYEEGKIEGAESLLKVIMNKMNGTIEEIITKKAENKRRISK